MRLNLYSRNIVFILGAGSSKDYGLPVWKELSDLIKEKIKKEGATRYPRANDILAWLGKVGEKKLYKTIDECIEKESVSETYYADGDIVENELFSSIKDIFDEAYVENNKGWITKLSDKILRQPASKLEDKISFVSYNYDNVLEKTLLRFGYLPGKHARLNNKPRLDQLMGASVPVLYAHGNLYSESEVPQGSHTDRHSNTMKSDNPDFIDVVSCYESYSHTVDHSTYSDNLELNILGLGGGLKFNLGRLNFSKKASKINVTVSDPKDDEEIIKFLSTKFKVPEEKISIYRTCLDLTEACF